MISALFRSNLFLLILISILGNLATVQAQGNVTVGDFLSANDQNRTWRSPSGDFAFGFHRIPGEEDRFI